MNALKRAKRRAKTWHRLLCRAKKLKMTSKAAVDAPARAKETFLATSRTGSLQLLV